LINTNEVAKVKSNWSHHQVFFNFL